MCAVKPLVGDAAVAVLGAHAQRQGTVGVVLTYHVNTQGGARDTALAFANDGQCARRCLG